MLCLDKYGWPVTRFKGRPVTNLIRKLIHTRKIVRGYWDGYKIVGTRKEGQREKEDE